MPKYSFKARNSLNELVEGVRSAGSDKEVLSSLRAEGMVVFSLKEAEEVVSRKEKLVAVFRSRSDSSPVAGPRKKSGNIGTQDLAVFCRQMATLVNAGVSILDAIDDMAVMVTNRKFETILRSIATKIREGTPLSAAMKEHERIFGKVFVSLIAAGEKSGKLGKVLLDLAKYMEKSVALQRKVKAASTYPLVVGCFFLLVFAALIFFIVPRFEAMFTQLGAELPLPTRMVMGASRTAIRNLPFLLLLAGGSVAGFIFFYRTPKGRFLVDHSILQVPILKDILLKIIFARFFQTMSTLLQSGVDIISSLEIAARVADNTYVERNIGALKERVIEGGVISVEMGRMRMFPVMITRMTAVGEKSGQMDEMFSKISDYYSDEVDGIVASLSSIIEPVLIVGLGVIVGVAVVSMYLPIFKLASAMMGKN